MTTEPEPAPTSLQSEFARLEELIKPLHQLLDLLERPEDDAEGLGQRLLYLLNRHHEALELLMKSAADLKKQNDDILNTMKNLGRLQANTDQRLTLIWKLLNGSPAEPSED